MSLQPPFIPPQSLATFVKEYFPLQSVDVESIKQFDGYDDRNYYFAGDLNAEISSSNDHKQFVIKFVNSRDSRNTKVLEGLSKLAQYLHGKNFKCPYPIPSADGCESGIVVLKKSDLLPYTLADSGKAEVDNTRSTLSNGFCGGNGTIDHQFCVRVTVFVDGELFGHGEQPPQLLHELGCYVAKMNKELMHFSNSEIKTRILDEWDLKKLLTKRKIIPIAISDPEQAKILHDILDDFEKHVVPIIDDMPDIERGYIHSDINCLNIIIKNVVGKDDRSQVSGLIDYSNAVFAPLVFELGIAMAYLMMRRENPASYVKPFLEGYLSIIPLSESSLNNLFHVILGRLAQSYLNGMYTYKVNPANEYVLVETAPGWELIKLLLMEGKTKCYSAWNI